MSFPTGRICTRRFSAKTGLRCMLAILTIRNGRISDLTNLSGTFRFDDPDGLIAVAEELERQGFTLLPDAVRLFPYDGSQPIILR